MVEREVHDYVEADELLGQPSTPTILSISPAYGPASGFGLVVIRGTNFRTYTPAAYGNLTGPTPCYVRVTFGDSLVESLWIISSTRIELLPPMYDGDVDAAVYPPVNVTVCNLGDDGNPMGGQSVTAEAAYTYQREPLRPPTLDIPSPFSRITRALLRLFKRSLLLETGMQTHTDYSEDGLAVAKVGMPSITIAGPEVTPDEYGWENEHVEDVDPSGKAFVYPNPIMHTLRYTLVGNSDSKDELFTLLGGVRKVPWRHPKLLIPADIPAGSYLRMPIVMTTEPEVVSDFSNANLRMFSAALEIRRVPILYLPPTMETREVASFNLEWQKLNGTLVETKPMW